MNPGEIRFLSRDEIEEIHAYLTAGFGGLGGIRDSGLLDSAVAAPQAGFGEKYLYADVFEMAAAYAVGIVGNHPFVDGNKRTGAMCAAIFLELNGFDFCASPEDFTKKILSVARGEIKAAELAEFFCRESRPKIENS